MKFALGVRDVRRGFLVFRMSSLMLEGVQRNRCRKGLLTGAWAVKSTFALLLQKITKALAVLD